MHAHYDIFPKRALYEAGQRRVSRAGPRAGSSGTGRTVHEAVLTQAAKLAQNRVDPRGDERAQGHTVQPRGPRRKPDGSNTFILSVTIIQCKRHYDWHSEYEPYAVLFHQNTPYALYAISKKPL
ncbi:hypothetical protein MMYC01_208055 [Madurella mycetomatis]|nr:hypothetical protein MMYC01_208055 [Madurella mycetomatis]